MQKIQGVTINAGAGVAHYPTQIPLHRRAKFLGNRDVFGELVEAARKLGLFVLARLDPNWGHEEIYKAHPYWFLTDAEGKNRQRGQSVPTTSETQFLSVTPLRHTAKPDAELRLFFAEAIANGQRAWWHVLGTELYDRKWLDTIANYFTWLAEIEPYLQNVESIADIAIVWSLQTFWLSPWTQMDPSPVEAFNGWYQMLLEGRVPFDLLPKWKLTTNAINQYRVLILPSHTCLREESIQALTEFVASGGGLVGCFEGGTKGLWSELHSNKVWSRLFGVRRVGEPPPRLRHCYMRVESNEHEHPILSDFGETDVLPGASYLSQVEALEGTQTLSFCPSGR